MNNNTDQIKTFRYKAFISYRHTEVDRKWARWLMQKLENYRVPKALVKQGVPVQVGTLFRDDEEIPASSNLTRQIELALEDSEFLIVVCSKNTPVSKWVRQEITYFHQIGRGDHILALLIDGEPDESFPPELTTFPADDEQSAVAPITKEIEPIAADVRPRQDEKSQETEKRALLRIAASLLKCRFDDLAQRHHARKKQHQRAVLGSLMMILFALIAGSIYWWDYTRIKTANFADYGTQWGVPYGIGPVSDNIQRHRAVTYAIDSQRRQVIGMRRINGSAGLIGIKGDIDGPLWHKDVAKWEIRYQDGKRINSVKLFNAQNKKLRTVRYEFSEDGKSAAIMFRQSAGKPQTLLSGISAIGQIGADNNARSDISQHWVEFDLFGRISKRSFKTASGQSAQDGSGSYGQVYRYSDQGQIITTSNLNQAGEVLIEKNSVTEVRRHYNKSGDLQEVSWHQDNGDLTHNTNQYAILKIIHNQYGNATEISYLGVNNQPILHKDGYAKILWTYDLFGNRIEQAYFGVDGQTIFNRGGYAKITADYDLRGNMIKVAYFGLDGEPILIKDGYAKLSMAYDLRGNKIEEAFFGLDGQPILHKIGYAKLTADYDSHGNRIEAAYFGLDGQPILTNNSLAKLTAAYDSLGNLIEESYFGVDGQPILIKKGYAKISWAYDQRSNLSKQAFFGADGQPILIKEGFAKLTIDYDQHGNLIELVFLGIDGKPILIKNGFAKSTMAYDPRGNKIEEAYFGIDGQPILHWDGYAKLTNNYDQRGNMIEQAYFGVVGQPIIIKDGYAKTTWKYDPRGNRIEEAYFGVDGEPVMVNQGYRWSAKLTMEYDTRDNPVEVTLFDVNGKIIFTQLLHESKK